MIGKFLCLLGFHKIHVYSGKYRTWTVCERYCGLSYTVIHDGEK